MTPEQEFYFIEKQRSLDSPQENSEEHYRKTSWSGFRLKRESVRFIESIK